MIGEPVMGTCAGQATRLTGLAMQAMPSSHWITMYMISSRSTWAAEGGRCRDSQPLPPAGRKRAGDYPDSVRVENHIARLDARADHYLVKPFDLDELAARVRALATPSHRTNKPAVRAR